MTGKLSHLDERGRARMVNVGEKPITHRVSVASGWVRMSRQTLDRIADGDLPKGDVFATARLAGIQAAKRTAEWIPLAHSLPLESVRVDFFPEQDEAGRAGLRVEAVAEAHWRTGVEMEALVAVAAAALTIYDMCKAVDREMSVEGVRLLSKRGGRSGDWVRPGVDPG